MLPRTDYADTFAGCFKGVADRAISQKPVRHRRTPPIERRMIIDDPACEHHGRGIYITTCPGRSKSVLGTRQCADLCLDKRDLEIGQLPQHAANEVAPRETLGKTRNVMAARNQRGSALAGVNDAQSPSKSAKIDRGHQSGRAAANNKAVQWHRSSSLRRFLYSTAGAIKGEKP